MRDSLTIQSAVDERHVHAQKLHDGLAGKENEGPYKSFLDNDLPTVGSYEFDACMEMSNWYSLSVCAVEHGTDLTELALLRIHALAYASCLPFQQDGRICCQATHRISNVQRSSVIGIRTLFQEDDTKTLDECVYYGGGPELVGQT